METIKIIIEFIAICLLLYGWTQEERVIAWEKELYKVLRQYYNKKVKPYAMRLLRKAHQSRRAGLQVH